MAPLGTLVPETHKFLKQFYLDLEELKNDFISDGECIFKMANNEVYICDAPVRSTMKGITSHTGYHSCERCTVKGQFDEHARYVCFLDVDCCLRTDLGKYTNALYRVSQNNVYTL